MAICLLSSMQDLPEKISEIPFAEQIHVPSNWQNHGFDTHQYTNINYPFRLIRLLSL